MLAPADVTKLECKVVVDILNYFKCRKTIIEPGLSTVRASLFLYASYLGDCLTSSQECIIKDIVLDPCEIPTPLTCEDQLDVVITTTTKTCTYKSSLDTPFPEFTFTQGSPYVNAFTTLKFTDTCSPIVPYSDETITGGCNSTTCSDSQKGALTTLYIGDFPTFSPMYPGSTYIKNIRLYRTDALGNITTYTDWDLTHGNSIYTASACPSCENVTASQTYLSHANFALEFGKLLKNIAKITFGDNTNRHTISPYYTTNKINFLQNVRHKPANAMGISIPRLVLYDNTTLVSYTLTDFSKSVAQTPIQFHYTSSPKNSNCGTYSPKVHNQSIPLNYELALVDFNSFGLPAKATTPLVLTDNNLPCTRYVFCHSASSIGDIVTKQWSLSWTPAISLEDCIYATNIGEYYSYICTESGCCSEITKEVTEHPPLNLTAYDTGSSS